MKNLGGNTLMGLLLILAMAGCQLSPTKVSDSAAPWNRLVEKTSAPLKVSEDTMILDARNSFDYGLAHISNSILFPWDKLAETSRSGKLLEDPHDAIRQLALLGLRPSTPVIVVGYGPQKGQGEVGRVAFCLLYYGIKDVQIVSIDALDAQISNKATVLRENTKPWTPELNSALVIDRKRFLKEALSKRQQDGHRIFILDVRSHKEYFSKLGRNGPYEVPDLQMLNIEWKEFYMDDGRPNIAIKKRLQGVGIQPMDRILLISNKGVRSSAAAYALLAIGYRNVQNYIGGWNELLHRQIRSHPSHKTNP